MERQEIASDKLNLNIFSFLNDRLLLGTGQYLPEAKGLPLPYNAMTISWGMMGTVWNKPMVQVMVRPQRQSYELLKGSDSFTLGLLPPSLKDTHQVFGSASGRDQDKFAATGVHPMASQRVAAPSFAEATLMIECKIVYRDRLDPGGFGAPYIKTHYRDDWHEIYWGEVVGIFQGKE